MAAVSETELITAALKDVKVPASVPPPIPRVVGTMFELGDDQAGDPAVFITVLLHDDTPDEDWVSSKLNPIADAVRQALYARAINRWPYVRFAKLSEAGGPDADEPAWRAVG